VFSQAGQDLVRCRASVHRPGRKITSCQIETALRRTGKGYVLGVASSHHFGSCGDKPAARRHG
jgi:hypothetical protein